MATLAEIAAGFKSTLSTINGLQVFDYVPASVGPTGPVCVVAPGPVVTLTVNSARGKREFRLIIGVPKSTDRPSQTVLWDLVDSSGDSSIHRKLLATPDLGVTGVTATWKGDGGLIDLADVIGLSYWGCEALVEVVFSGGA